MVALHLGDLSERDALVARGRRLGEAHQVAGLGEGHEPCSPTSVTTGCCSPFRSCGVGQPLEGILGIWRNLWEDSFDLATHALMYTKAQLKAAEEVERQGARSRLPLGA